MFRRLFGFQGRMGRADYLLASLGVFGVVALMLPLLLVASMTSGRYGSGGLEGPGLLIIPVALVGLCAQAALAAKRLHDIGRSGWHLLWIALLPLPAALLPGLLQLAASVVPWICLCAVPGTPEENRYGAAVGIGVGG